MVYVIDEDHEQYCQLTLEEQAKIIAAANGGRGSNYDYLCSTRNRLTELSIEDPEIEMLYNKVLSIKEQRDD